MYAVVAPGLKGVYEDFKVIEKIQALYPYAKFRKFRTEEECWTFLTRNENKRGIEQINNFGDTFNRHRVVMTYILKSPDIYYNFMTGGLGTLRLMDDGAVIENRTNLVKARINDVVVDCNQISGHVIAIYNGLKLLGDYVDVEVIVPDHSIFYAMHSYTGSNWVITKLMNRIRSRLGNVSITLREEV